MAERVAGAAPAAAEPSWRGIDELARLVGAFCWAEQRLFEITGAWAARPGTGPGDGPLGVWCAAASRRHGELARAWADRLPVRAGVDRGALVAPPSAGLAAAFEDLAGTPRREEGFAVLVSAVLPRLRHAYGATLGSASPVCEAPVMEVLVRAEREIAGELAEAGLSVGAGVAGTAGPPDLGEPFKRSFDAAGVFPAVRPS